MNKNVIYTCITNHYDKLRINCTKCEGYDYVCFTDDLTIKNENWILKPIPEKIKNLSYTKQQRYIKLHPHELLPNYELSICIDSNVDVLQDINPFIENILEENINIYIPKHPVRNCIYEEAKECINLKKDNEDIINRQISFFLKEGFPKNYGLTQNNIIIRRHNDKGCQKIMEEWWNIIEQGSKRDQLSLFYCLWKNPDIKIKQLDSSTDNSEYFKWGREHDTE